MMYLQASPVRRARVKRAGGYIGGYAGAGRIYEVSIGGAISDLGKKKRSVLKKVMRVARAVRKKIEPKFITKFRQKVFSKKNFMKFAPILAGIAQVLNIVPGLGVAVGFAIMAGAAAVTVAVALVAKRDQKIAIKEAEKAEEKRTAEEATSEANKAFDVGEQYFGERYGMTKAEFTALPLEQKMAFLEQAVLDKKAEDEKAEAGGDILMYGLAALALVFVLSRKKG